MSNAQGAPVRADHLQMSLPQIFAFAMPAIATAGLGIMMGLFMPRYFAQHLGLSLLAIGGTLSLVRIIDIFFELPMGWAMDHTRTAIGRYRPWYVIGVPILALSVYMLFVNSAGGMTTGYLFLWYFILSIGTSIMTLAHQAWAATLATDYHQRSRVFGWLTAVATTGSVGILALPALTRQDLNLGFVTIPAVHLNLGQSSTVTMVGWAIVIGLPILAVLSALLSPEPRTKDIHREQVDWRDYWNMIRRPTAIRLVLGDLFLTLGPGLTSPIYIFFFTTVKHFSAIDCATLLIFYIGAPFVGAPLWARVARILGKHRTLQFGTLVYAITQTTLMILPAGTFWPHAAGMFAVGLSNAGFGLMIRAMLADYSDELRLEQGVQRVSLLYSFVGVTLKLGSSLNTGITFAILAAVGFQAAEGARNTPGAIFGLSMTYLFAPIVFVVIGGLFFFGYKLDETRHREIRDALDERDAEEAVIAGGPIAAG
jgi:Na+/melibiose symporter-like transporter